MRPKIRKKNLRKNENRGMKKKYHVYRTKYKPKSLIIKFHIIQRYLGNSQLTDFGEKMENE